jgi:hypothetical protein
VQTNGSTLVTATSATVRVVATAASQHCGTHRWDCDAKGECRCSGLEAQCWSTQCWSEGECGCSGLGAQPQPAGQHKTSTRLRNQRRVRQRAQTGVRKEETREKINKWRTTMSELRDRLGERARLRRLRGEVLAELTSRAVVPTPRAEWVEPRLGYARLWARVIGQLGPDAVTRAAVARGKARHRERWRAVMGELSQGAARLGPKPRWTDPPLGERRRWIPVLTQMIRCAQARTEQLQARWQELLTRADAGGNPIDLTQDPDEPLTQEVRDWVTLGCGLE